MKKIYTYIALATALWAVVGCITADLNPNIPAVENGDDVKFGLSLQNPDTKTVYGDESGNAFPIYWVDGDKVTVFSPQSLEGRRSAEYKVTVDEPKNFADQLTRTGEYGIQWGEGYTAEVGGKSINGLHDFYSLYPSGNYTLSENGTLAKGVTIYSNQNVVVGETSVKSDMQDCLMYAATTQVKKGDVVNLRYKPISTVLYVTMSVAANEVNTPEDKFTIQSLTLTAGDGTYIAGTFSLDIDTGEFYRYDLDNTSKVVNASNVVSAQIASAETGEFVTLVNEQSVSVPLFLTPDPDLNANGWKLTVVANNESYTKTLKFDDGGGLTPGMIHKVSLPQFSTAKEEWDSGSWMERIPRNVYLSEISIPGTWNSLNQDCQTDQSISGQYSKGVRAFHLDTRWRSDNNPVFGSTFTGITKPTITTLSVAIGGSNKTNSYDGGNLMKKSSADSFAEYLKDITDEVSESEYMIVFCTFAQNSYNGDRCPSTWYKAVSDACAENDKVYDASTITNKTLVGDVLNSVIVVVNLDSEVSAAALPESSKCLFTHIPMLLPSNYHAEGTSHVDELLYSSNTSSGISMYTTHAQISTTGSTAVNCGDRGYSHPLASRDALVNSIWDWSKDNYGTTAYQHDKWMYLGLGGYIMTSSSDKGTGTYATIENRYATMLYDRIDEMGKNSIPFYPVGIVLMNNVKGTKYEKTVDGKTTELNYGFSELCRKVLLLNNKYRLQYDPNKPIDYDPNALSLSDYAATSSNGGSAISLD